MKNKNKLIIRLQRKGRISRPIYFIIVTKKYKNVQGSYLAKVGFYDPFSSKNKGFLRVVIFKDVLHYWIARGAVPNETVKKLLYD